jgi:hypothetical protein
MQESHESPIANSPKPSDVKNHNNISTVGYDSSAGLFPSLKVKVRF